MEIKQKAWKISAKDLNEPWYYDDVIIQANNRGEARSKGLTEMFNSGASKEKDYLDKHKDTDLVYTDIIAHRCKDYDIILFEGKEIKRNRLESKLWERERDEKALQLSITNPNDLAVVYAGCYRGYWGANHSGYSDDIIFAGKYTTREAYEIVRGSDHGRQETVKLLNVEEFNSNINNQIEKLQKQMDRLKTYRIEHEKI